MISLAPVSAEATAPRRSTRPPAHMPALDGLRGTAVLLVLACHSAGMTREIVRTSLDSSIDRVLGAGWIGVDLFFVLSGFLITGILLATRGAPTYYKSFFARRFLRILPLYYVVVVASIVWNRHLLHVPDGASLLFFFYNWRVVVLGHHLPMVNPLWSLGVEEQFYFAWPTIVLLLSRKALLQLCVAGMILALALRMIVLLYSPDFQSAYYLTPCRMDTLLVGALLAIWRSDEKTWKQVERLATPVALCAAVALCGIAAWSGHFMDFVTQNVAHAYRHTSIAVLGPGCTLLALLFGGILVKCTGRGLVFRLFAWEPLRQIGKYSYGMYMLHWPIVLMIRKLVLSRLRYLPVDGAALLCLVLLVAVSFGAAYVSFELFERHFLRLKRRFPAEARSGGA